MSGRGISQQGAFLASGTGAVERTDMAKMRDEVSVKDFGATGDGTTDDTTAIQAAITATAAQGGSVLFPAGTYLTTLPLVVPSNSTLIGRGAKIKFSNTVATDTPISLSAVSTVTISGLEIDGQKASVATVTEQKHAILIKSSTDITLRDIYAHDNKGDGLYIGADNGAAVSSRIYVENYRSDSNYRNGLSITNCSGGRFVGFKGTNTTGTAPQAGMDIEPNFDTDTIKNIEFIGCEFTGNTGYGGQVVLRDTPSGVQRGVRFTNSVFNSNTGGGMLLWSAVQVAFVASDFSSNPGAAADGIVINKNSSDISIVDSMIRLNQINGINLNVTALFTVSRIRVVNTTILDNRQVGGAGAGDGIVTSGTLNGLTVIGSDLSNYAGATQRNGIATSSGTTGVTLIGNTATANASNNSTLSDDLTSRYSGGNNGIPNIPNGTRKVITYSTSMTPDTGAGTEFYINATNGVAFTINAPTTNVVGQDLTIRIRNASGGALGAVTWNGTYHMSAWTQPANGQSRFITFRWDPTSTIWMQVNPAGVDVPN